MKNVIRVTAIVSTYNGERFIRGCLEDLVAQTLFERGELEILIIDAASPQNEAAIAAEFTAWHPAQIRYFRTPARESLYAAWNRAIPLAKGGYLANANVDDRHDPACLEVLAAALDAGKAAAMAYPDSDVTTDENVSFGVARRARRLAWPDFSRDALFEIPFIGPHPMWRKSLHALYGIFDAAMRCAGDYEFWLRLAAGGEYFVHVPRPLSLYLDNPASISLANVDLTWQESEEARDRYWRPQWGIPPKFCKALPHFERLKRRLGQLPAGSRIALYGAGKHTQKMLPLFRQAIEPHAKLIGILDDAPGAKTQIDDIPILPASQWHTLIPAAIITSSDTYEPQLLTQLQKLIKDSIPLVTVYQ